jgi:GGDEF domain-containing protein
VTALLYLVLTFAARGAAVPPVQGTISAPAGADVRLRCGSETLRAKLRDGRMLAQLGTGEVAVLAPVKNPRRKSSEAYSDGKLTLYKAPDAKSWTVAQAGKAVTTCRPDAPADQGTGKSAIPAK